MREHLRLGTMLAAVALLLVGCSSSTPSTGNDAGTDGLTPDAGPCPEDSYRCETTGECQPIEKTCKTEPNCEPYQVLDYGSGPFTDTTTCQPIPQDCTCKNNPPLQHGVIGRHSALVVQSGTLHASAYENDYGDLVLISASVGDPAQTSVEIVDGVPDAAPTNDPGGYRQGISDPGDDVGLYTDIASTADALMIAYHDRGNRSLKFARRGGEAAWALHTVAAPVGDAEVVGRHTALAILDGKPAVVFLAINVDLGDGRFGSALRWAVASSATPGAPGDWTIETIAEAPMDCAGLCDTGQACFVDAEGGSQCLAEGSGCTDCTDQEACLDGQCAAIVPDAGLEDVPRVLGLWPALVVIDAAPLVAFHDATKGTLNTATRGDTEWTVNTLVGTPDSPTGGFCALAVGADGTVHLSYQELGSEILRYRQLDASGQGTPVSEIVDDGVRSDGKHAVGADSAIVVDPSGAVRVIYQDQLNSDLLTAVRAGDDDWQPQTTGDADLGRLLKGGARGYGFFTDLATDGSQTYGSSFYFDAQSEAGGGLEFFTVP